MKESSNLQFNPLQSLDVFAGCGGKFLSCRVNNVTLFFAVHDQNRLGLTALSRSRPALIKVRPGDEAAALAVDQIVLW